MHKHKNDSPGDCTDKWFIFFIFLKGQGKVTPEARHSKPVCKCVQCPVLCEQQTHFNAGEGIEKIRNQAGEGKESCE